MNMHTRHQIHSINNFVASDIAMCGFLDYINNLTMSQLADKNKVLFNMNKLTYPLNMVRFN